MTLRHCHLILNRNAVENFPRGSLSNPRCHCNRSRFQIGSHRNPTNSGPSRIGHLILRVTSGYRRARPGHRSPCRVACPSALAPFRQTDVWNQFQIAVILGVDLKWEDRSRAGRRVRRPRRRPSSRERRCHPARRIPARAAPETGEPARRGASEGRTIARRTPD